jgi:hypothetical protein
VLLRVPTWNCLFLLVAALAAAQQSSSAPDVNTIVARMMVVRQEYKARAQAYIVKRNYELLDKQAQPKAQVVASIAFNPPDHGHYTIESSSGGMGQKVLRDILQKETETHKDAERKELSPENYEFRLLGNESLDGRTCYILAMAPRRQEKDMMRGKIWVDALDYRIHRIEGNPVKSPSWWIRDLHIQMSFNDVNGMWLRTFTHAVADVRFSGQYIMESRDLEYTLPQQTAGKRHRHPGILFGAAVNP